MKKVQKIVFCIEIKILKYFYRKLLEQNQSKEDILIWNPFMNTDLEEDFGVYTNYLKKKKSL